MQHDDTIAAIATPLGQGGIGIIRISGSASLEVLRALFRPSSSRFGGFRPWTLHHGTITDGCDPLDDVLAVHMPGPRTFTGEDVSEIHCHGGSGVLAAVLEACVRHGARYAERGEFTRRAFLNGRMDLTQAEAVAEMIAAPSREGMRLAQAKLDGLLGQRVGALRARLDALRMQLCVAVDFPEEEVECLAPEAFLAEIEAVRQGVVELSAGYARTRCWQDGALVVLAGQVNAGKSSLMNALLGRRRAIVTDLPGTTRDFIEEPLNLSGLAIRLADTAGLRETGDIVEQEGVRMSRDLVAQADLVLLVTDATQGLQGPELELLRHAGPERVLVVFNKTDLLEGRILPSAPEGCRSVHVAAASGDGVESLVTAIRAAVLAATGAGEPEAGELAPNMRQAAALDKAATILDELAGDIRAHVPYDLCGVRLDGACAALMDVTGQSTPEAILDAIFASFCIGK